MSPFTNEQYQIIGHPIDEKVAQVITVMEGHTAVFIREIRDEVVRELETHDSQFPDVD